MIDSGGAAQTWERDLALVEEALDGRVAAETRGTGATRHGDGLDAVRARIDRATNLPFAHPVAEAHVRHVA